MLGLPRRFSPFGLLPLLLVFVGWVGANSAAEPAADPAADAPAAAEKPPRENRLAGETSPYLLLHAHNPVDWYPWGPEALAKAREENKVIFLSIGYSSCHWCHVMERESFEDEEIAAFLNEHFVCIKVDREERPDVDEIYMEALHIYYQALGMRRGGGWPLSMFLTPEAQPILGGTYYPPRDNELSEGFLTVIERVARVWDESAEALRERGELLADYVESSLRQRPALSAELPPASVANEITAALAERFDPEYGGFGYNEADPRTPKFPQGANLMFLLDQARRSDGPKPREMLTKTLDAIAQGGIRDHVGGGFHRYSVDRFWHIPHFEKMLYDNAQLATLYAEAWELTGDENYRQVVEETLEFVRRELTDAEGGFLSALDAESGGSEGGFYGWTPEEVRGLLDEAEYETFAEVYGLGDEPNFEELHILLLDGPLSAARAKSALEPAEFDRVLAAARAKLLTVRDARPRPRTDTKILTDWNGLMIRGYADAGRILEQPAHVEAAARSAEFVLRELRTEDGRLLHAYAAGQAKLNAYLDDYAFLIDGLIALHRATGEARWLTEADALMQKQIELFWDEQGGFYFTSDDHEKLLARSKDPADAETPSGNAVSADNLAYLGRALDKPEYFDRAERTIRAFGPLWEQYPAGLPRMAVALAALRDAR